MTLRALRFALPLALVSAVATADDLASAVVSAELGRRHEAELFRKAMSDPSPRVRATAARAVGRLKERTAIALLLPLLRDEAGRVRRAALFALGQIGGEEIVIPVREALGRMADNDLAVAIEALGKTRDPRATAAITGRLGHRAPAVRAAAALALFRLGDSSTVPELAGALRVERDADVRWKQVYSISRLLRARVGKTKALVTPDGAWIEPLRAATAKDRPFFERGFAARALGALAEQGGFLVQLTGDSDPRVVVSALRALATNPAPDRPELFAALTRHEDDLVRETAVQALERCGDKVADHWIDVLRHLRGRLRMSALLALAKAGDVRGPAAQFTDDEAGKALTEEYAWRLVPYLPDDAAHPDPRELESVAAMRAAASSCTQEGVGIEWATIVLHHLLTVDDFTVRTMAVGALAERGAKSSTPRIVAAAKASRGPEWVDVRSQAAAALATLEVYDPWLDEAAKNDPDRFVRTAAREALAKLERPLPPERRPGGFQLDGKNAAQVLAAAAELTGARVRLKTTRGTITMVLLPDEAPAHCVNLARLVARGFYDGKRWHRVVADFVIQGGCPRGDGWGGPGYTVPDEIGTRPYVRGTVGMPKAGDDTGGCQIFITHLPTPHLDGRYTVFAQVIEGFDVIDRVRVGDRIEKATLAVPEKR